MASSLLPAGAVVLAAMLLHSCLPPCWSAAATPAIPASKPAAAPKFTPATAAEIATNKQATQDLADKAKAVTARTHLVETAHFLIYTAGDAASDSGLRTNCEKLYTALCEQFVIPVKDNIWAGKCPLYIFGDAADFKAFAKETKGQPDAAAYCVMRNSFVYVVLGPARTTTGFFELLVHECTHAFMARYVSNRDVPIWVHEGVADLAAGTLVAGASAAGKPAAATVKAIREKSDVLHVFDKVGLNKFDYGIAQSFVQFLISRDRKAFADFVAALKQGQSEADALKEYFGYTRQTMVDAWRKAANVP
jgi:hypothetical protein